jgi:hypothetical protein
VAGGAAYAAATATKRRAAKGKRTPSRALIDPAAAAVGAGVAGAIWSGNAARRRVAERQDYGRRRRSRRDSREVPLTTRRPRRAVTMRVKSNPRLPARMPGLNAGHARTRGAHPPGYLGSGTRRSRAGVTLVAAGAVGAGRAVHRRRKARRRARTRRDSQGRFT